MPESEIDRLITSYERKISSLEFRLSSKTREVDSLKDTIRKMMIENDEVMKNNAEVRQLLQEIKASL
jgi:regulator of replication initiation timing